ncbi:MAG: site-specific integrase [Mariprofundaceae bacterium]
MPRFGKKQDRQRDIRAQARAFIASRTKLGQSKDRQGGNTLHSVRTSQEMARALGRAAESIKQEHGISQLREITRDMAMHYLEARADIIGQKALDNERRALQLLAAPGYAMEGQKLDRIRTDAGQVRYPSGRAYTADQIERIASSQRAHNALATRIAYAAGLRQHELYTLRRIEERPPSPGRKWTADRFHGREGVRYTVEGKGGLVREVLIPTALARELEARRLDAPITVRDQGVIYQKHYDIGAGRAWAASFRAAATRSIGWHRGPHGVRHAFAQERMRELQAAGASYRRALGIVSQELGHFRPDITEVYLR